MHALLKQDLTAILEDKYKTPPSHVLARYMISESVSQSIEHISYANANPSNLKRRLVEFFNGRQTDQLLYLIVECSGPQRQNVHFSPLIAKKETSALTLMTLDYYQGHTLTFKPVRDALAQEGISTHLISMGGQKLQNDHYSCLFIALELVTCANALGVALFNAFQTLKSAETNDTENESITQLQWYDAPPQLVWHAQTLSFLQKYEQNTSQIFGSSEILSQPCIDQGESFLEHKSRNTSFDTTRNKEVNISLKNSLKRRAGVLLSHLKSKTEAELIQLVYQDSKPSIYRILRTLNLCRGERADTKLKMAIVQNDERLEAVLQTCSNDEYKKFYKILFSPVIGKIIEEGIVSFQTLVNSLILDQKLKFNNPSLKALAQNLDHLKIIDTLNRLDAFRTNSTLLFTNLSIIQDSFIQKCVIDNSISLADLEMIIPNQAKQVLSNDALPEENKLRFLISHISDRKAAKSRGRARTLSSSGDMSIASDISMMSPTTLPPSPASSPFHFMLDKSLFDSEKEQGDAAAYCSSSTTPLRLFVEDTQKAAVEGDKSWENPFAALEDDDLWEEEEFLPQVYK